MYTENKISPEMLGKVPLQKDTFMGKQIHGPSIFPHELSLSKSSQPQSTKEITNYNNLNTVKL